MIPGLSAERFADLQPLAADPWGESFAALDRRLGAPVRLRVLDAARVDAARRAARVSHPNLERVLEVLELDGRAVLVAELPEGETLAERLRGARGSLEEALLVGQQLAAALAALHAEGVAHGGFDPASATWLGHGAVKASALAPGPARPDYRAPEVRGGGMGDALADQWSAGAVVHELIAGRPPDGTALAELVPGLPGHVSEVVMRALAVERAARWPDMAAFERALGEAHAALTGTPLVSFGGAALKSGGSYGGGYRSRRRRRGWGGSSRFRLPVLPVNTGAVAFGVGVLVLWGFYTTVSRLAGDVFGGLRVVKTARQPDEPAPPPAPGNLGTTIVGGSGLSTSANPHGIVDAPHAAKDVMVFASPAPEEVGESCRMPADAADEVGCRGWLRCRLELWIDRVVTRS